MFVGSYYIKLTLKIEYKRIEYKDIVIKINVIDIPIQPENNLLNLNYLLESHLFREKIILKNNSNIVYKVQIFNHKHISDFIELNPNLGYIQVNIIN